MFDKNKLKIIGIKYYIKLLVIEKLSKIIKKIFFSAFEWQVTVKLISNPVYKIHIRCGTSDYECFHVIFIQNDYQEILNQVKGDLEYMIDCGANVGYTALYFALNCPNIKIKCFEPDLSNYDQAVKNLAEFRNIEIHQKAIWFKDSHVKVINGAFGNGGKWALTVEECNRKEGIEAVSLSKILDPRYINSTFLKIDIEGAEKMILLNPENWITQFKYLAIELHTVEIEKSYKQVLEKYQLKDLGLFGEMFLAKNN
jgi:FkbM family methyltransferase